MKRPTFTPAEAQTIVSELARVRVEFQLRTLALVLGLPPGPAK